MSVSSRDRSRLIRLASGMEKGSGLRKAILAGLQKTSEKADGTVRAFTKVDYMGYAGAVPFTVTTQVPPWMALLDLKPGTYNGVDVGEDAQATIVCDSEICGIDISWEGGNEYEGHAFFASRGNSDPEVAKSLAEGIVKALKAGRIPSGFKREG